MMFPKKSEAARQIFPAIFLAIFLMTSPAWSNPGDMIWSYKLGGLNAFPALGDDGTIYMPGSNNAIYAITSDGAPRWHYQTPDSLFSSAAIGPDGTLYAGNSDSQVYAMKPDGTVRWTYQTGGWPRTVPAIGSDGTIYVGSYDTYVYALTPEGKLKWRLRTGGTIGSWGLSIGADGTLYVGNNDHNLYAISPDGTLRWRYLTGGPVRSCPAIGEDGTIYVGSDDYYLYAINPDGTLKWSYQTDGSVWASPAIGSDGTIFVGSGDHYLYAITPSGALKWKYLTDGGVSGPAIGSDGTVYVGSYDHYLYAITPEGTRQWRYKTDGILFSSPAIGADGTLYIGSYDDYLHAITGNSPWTYEDFLNAMSVYADSNWPGFGQNNFNLQQKYEPVLYLGNVQTYRNATVSVPLFLNNVESLDIEGVDVEIRFDSTALEAQNATLKDGVLEDQDYEIHYETGDDQIRVTLYATGSLLKADGIIAYLEFTFTGESGEKSALQFGRGEINESAVNTGNGSVHNVSYTVSGTIRYYNPSDEYLFRNAAVQMEGSGAYVTTSDEEGEYVFTDIPRGDYRSAPSKADDLGGLGGMDASRIARYAAGLIDLNCYQRIAADVSQNGEVSGTDASRVARYIVGDLECLNDDCLHWAFTSDPIEDCADWPPIAYSSKREYDDLAEHKEDQDFIAIRLGDVTGNWPGNSDDFPSDKRRNISRNPQRFGEISVNKGHSFTLPFVLDEAASIEAVEIRATFDEKALHVRNISADGGILADQGYRLMTRSDTPGEASVISWATRTVHTGRGTLAFVTFGVSETLLNRTVISLEKFVCNESPANGGFYVNGKACKTVFLSPLR